MTAEAPTILATSMGFNRAREPWRPGPVFSYAFELSGTPARPRLCFVATAGGDQQPTITNFYRAFAGSDVQCSHLALFDKPNVVDIGGYLLAQDVVWVDRGSVANLLAVWRAHGLDVVLRECWRAGVVLAGESAGSLCWHSSGTTDSFGSVRAFTDGLGFLPHMNAVHYGDRREQVHRLVSDGTLPDGYATDAGAGLRYRGTELVEAVADRRNASAYRIERQPDGTVKEQRLETKRLRQ
jgi:peptidase E